MNSYQKTTKKDSDIDTFFDPLSKYNFVIKCCNDPINRDNQIFLKEVPNNRIYKL
jgi:hypothetical protein